MEIENERTRGRKREREKRVALNDIVIYHL